MPNLPGADARPSRTLQSLDRFAPDGIAALAVVGLLLLDAINHGDLIVSDIAPQPRASGLHAIINQLYVLQDAIHGSADKLQAALGKLLDLAKGGAQ